MKLLNILHLEDDSTDAELIQAVLEERGTGKEQQASLLTTGY
jgi:hypothetical protein